MSTCISSHGEFGSHIVATNYVCVRCYTLDEDGLTAELEQLRATADTLRSKGERQAAEILRLAAGIAEMIKGADRAAAFVRGSRGWGTQAEQIARVYTRAARRLRAILSGAPADVVLYIDVELIDESGL